MYVVLKHLSALRIELLAEFVKYIATATRGSRVAL